MQNNLRTKAFLTRTNQNATSSIASSVNLDLLHAGEYPSENNTRGSKNISSLKTISAKLNNQKDPKGRSCSVVIKVVCIKTS